MNTQQPFLPHGALPAPLPGAVPSPASPASPAAAAAAAAATGGELPPLPQLIDVSAGLVSRVHCTADGHVTITSGQGALAPSPTAPAYLEPSPPPAFPPASCLDVGRRYLAAVLAAVSGGLTDSVRGELLSLLHPDVEARIGVTGTAPPGRGVDHFMRALSADNKAYDEWRMVLLSSAAPPGGGEVFLWVDESARNVGPLPGMEAATNRTSHSLTVHRLQVDPSGRITQAWTRYQLFDELRSLLLVSPAADEPAEEAATSSPLAPSEHTNREAVPGAGPVEMEVEGAAAAAAAAASAGGGGEGAGQQREREWHSWLQRRRRQAAAPDLSALPFVQRLTGRVATAAASASGDHHLEGQGEGAAAQAQAAYAVSTATLAGAPHSAPAPAGPGDMPHPLAAPLADMTLGSPGGHPLTKPLAAAPAAATAAPAGPEVEPRPPALEPPLPGGAAGGGGGSGVVGRAGGREGAEPAVPDLEAQAGRSVSTWLGLVDSSYSGMMDVFGCTVEGLALWEPLGLWPHLQGARGRDHVLGQLQQLHREYDIRVRRGSWAVDRGGCVAFCTWEAAVRKLDTSPGVGVGSGGEAAGLSGVQERAGSPAATAAVGSSGGMGGAAGPSEEDRAMRLGEGEGEASTTDTGGRGRGGGGGETVTWTSMDVYGLSPQGHLTDVVMYRTALPGEAEGLIKKPLAAPTAAPQTGVLH